MSNSVQHKRGKQPGDDPTRTIPMLRWCKEAPWYQEHEDDVAVEEPLDVRLVELQSGELRSRTVAITMRTPGADEQLALGFLFTEGVLMSPEQVAWVRHCGSFDSPQPNVLKVGLAHGTHVDWSSLERHAYTTSSCGVCGKTSIDAVLRAPGGTGEWTAAPIQPKLLEGLPGKLRAHQRIFETTGGLHAAALFSAEGDLLTVFEDVGRHNALDKLIGWLWQSRQLPASNTVLLLSGRASFELLQKASMAAIPVVAAVGAPSSLAVAMAERAGITLLGFLREGRFNVYSHPHRLALSRIEVVSQDRSGT